MSQEQFEELRSLILEINARLENLEHRMNQRFDHLEDKLLAPEERWKAQLHQKPRYHPSR